MKSGRKPKKVAAVNANDMKKEKYTPPNLVPAPSGLPYAKNAIGKIPYTNNKDQNIVSSKKKSRNAINKIYNDCGLKEDYDKNDYEKEKDSDSEDLYEEQKENMSNRKKTNKKLNYKWNQINHRILISLLVYLTMAN